MAKYIELEAAVKAFNNFDAGRADSPPFTLLTPEEFAEYLYELPAADVAPVVHCRHCRSYNRPRLGWCSVHLDREGPDDFCGYGCPRDGDDDAKAD